MTNPIHSIIYILFLFHSNNMTTETNFNTVQLWIDDKNTCDEIPFRLSDRSPVEGRVNEFIIISRQPNATFKFKQNQELETTLRTRINNTHTIRCDFRRPERCYYLRLNGQPLRFEHLCQMMINTNEGETYDCHTPDIILN